MPISGVSPVRASLAVSPTEDQVAHEYWQESVVVKMDGTSLYWDESNERWTSRIYDATVMTRQEANQRSQHGRLKGYVVRIERSP